MEKVDYQIVYDEKYKEVYEECKAELGRALRYDEKYTLHVKFDRFKNELYDEFSNLGNEPASTGYVVGKYFEELIKEFDRRLGIYSTMHHINLNFGSEL